MSSNAGSPRETPYCANCGVEIPWPPTMHRGETFCCGGCAQGGPCYCSYDLTTFDWLYPANRRDQPAPTPAPAGVPTGTPAIRSGKREPGWS
jgi:hypothetical protein